jgi:hypothetical protein
MSSNPIDTPLSLNPLLAGFESSNTPATIGKTEGQQSVKNLGTSPLTGQDKEINSKGRNLSKLPLLAKYSSVTEIDHRITKITKQLNSIIGKVIRAIFGGTTILKLERTMLLSYREVLENTTLKEQLEKHKPILEQKLSEIKGQNESLVAQLTVLKEELNAEQQSGAPTTHMPTETEKNEKVEEQAEAQTEQVAAQAPEAPPIASPMTKEVPIAKQQSVPAAPPMAEEPAAQAADIPQAPPMAPPIAEKSSIAAQASDIPDAPPMAPPMTKEAPKAKQSIPAAPPMGVPMAEEVPLAAAALSTTNASKPENLEEPNKAKPKMGQHKVTNNTQLLLDAIKTGTKLKKAPPQTELPTPSKANAAMQAILGRRSVLEDEIEESDNEEFDGEGWSEGSSQSTSRSASPQSVAEDSASTLKVSVPGNSRPDTPQQDAGIPDAPPPPASTAPSPSSSNRASLLGDIRTSPRSLKKVAEPKEAKVNKPSSPSLLGRISIPQHLTSTPKSKKGEDEFDE